MCFLKKCKLKTLHYSFLFILTMTIANAVMAEDIDTLNDNSSVFFSSTSLSLFMLPLQGTKTSIDPMHDDIIDEKNIPLALSTHNFLFEYSLKFNDAYQRLLSVFHQTKVTKIHYISEESSLDKNEINCSNK